MLGAKPLPMTGRVAPKARGGVIDAPKKAFYDGDFSHFITPTPLGCAERPSPQGGGCSRSTSEANARLPSYAKVSSGRGWSADADRVRGYGRGRESLVLRDARLPTMGASYIAQPLPMSRAHEALRTMPSTTSTIRSQRCARSILCVTIRNVVPRSRLTSRIRSKT